MRVALIFTHNAKTLRTRPIKRMRNNIQQQKYIQQRNITFSNAKALLYFIVSFTLTFHSNRAFLNIVYVLEIDYIFTIFTNSKYSSTRRA